MNVALGVGEIAAYKAAELARALMERGFSVEAVLTSAAQRFITPLTLSALTGKPARTELFDAMDHIRIAQDNAILVIAPATADLIAKLANGLADDLLTTSYLAFTGTVVIAPAMNTNMWNHPATVANLTALRQRGHVIVEPDAGALACGMVGPGRLADPSTIAEVVAGLRRAPDLKGHTVLITAGPTQEPLDPVRYITNRSSGKMGYALAQAALARGARVILVSGPVNLAPPAGAELVNVRTAAQMLDAVLSHLDAATMIIKAAAVADYHRSDVPTQKMKKSGARLSIELEPTIDILAEVGKRKGSRFLIGFAAETDNLVAEAKRKLETKNCDMVVANLATQAFDSNDNAVTLVRKSGATVEIAKASKLEVAHKIYDQALQK